VTFEEYRGQATDAAGNVRKFIADDEAHFFPLRTANTFRTYYAPADFNETANTLRLPLYAKQEPRKFGRGTDLHTQQNPLPIWLRPESVGQRHQGVSDWASLTNALNATVLGAFGREVVYTPQPGTATTIRAIFESTREPEENAPGVHAVLLVRAGDLLQPTERGDE